MWTDDADENSGPSFHTHTFRPTPVRALAAAVLGCPVVDATCWLLQASRDADGSTIERIVSGGYHVTYGESPLAKSNVLTLVGGAGVSGFACKS